MSRAGILILLGVLTILIPFSGLPIAIRSMLAVAFGACVLAIGISLRLHQTRDTRLPAETPASPSEQTPPQSVSPI